MSEYHQIGIGATEELKLRVSVGSLVKVLFKHPEDGKTMLALERVATLGKSVVTVRAKPFGGGVRIIDPLALKELIGDFHYDSTRSRIERDFRILIHPASWTGVKELCQGHLKSNTKQLLDFSSDRELVEEFEDTLGIKITPIQYRVEHVGIAVEDQPAKTDNVRALGTPTVRLYYVFVAWIEDGTLIEMMLDNSRRYSDKDLRNIAWDDAGQGGKGRANAVLVLALDDLLRTCLPIPQDNRGGLIHIGEYQLDSNVWVIMQEVECSRYQFFSRSSQ